jgi:hypothetical protein
MLSKRDFTNFTEFPGSIDYSTNLYTFPQLKHTDVHGNVRQWQIFVRLVKDQNRQTECNFNLLEEKQVNIIDDYFTDNVLPSGTIAQTYTESGVSDGIITRSAPSYFDTVAFIGQSNQRNPFQQALISARALFLKKKERGMSEKNQTIIKTSKYFPMLAVTYKIGAKHLVYPLYIQCKLDGIRCVTYLLKPNTNYKSVMMYSRSQKEFPSLDYLKIVLYPYLNDLYDHEKKQSIYLDGELYKHGKRLQEISGETRNENNTIQNQYHIYDCFYPLELDTKFSTRTLQVKQIFDVMNENNDVDAKNLIKYVKTTLVKSAAEVNKLFDSFIEHKYEGAILRNADSPYIASTTSANTRSKNLVKMKNKFTDEFTVVGFTQGTKGKDVGAVIWLAETKKKIRFSVTPKDMTYAERKKIYQLCLTSFDTLYANRQLTVEYEDLSEDLVPLRAKALAFRDYE